MKKETKEAFHKLELFSALTLAVVVLGLFLSTKEGLLSIEGNKVTGFVSADIVTQPIDITADRSTSFRLSTSEPFILTSLRLSGITEGKGVARVFLDTGDEKFLVYTNEQEKKAGNLITGYAIKITQLPDKTPDAVPLEGMTAKAGKFYNECRQTCFLNLKLLPEKEYRLVVQLSPGTSVSLTQLSYTSAE